MKIYVGADHGGFELKKELLTFLENEGFKHVVDVGASSYIKTDDYPDYAELVANEVANSEGSFGILICKSGNGMCIAANKVKGAYAALCFSEHHAEKTRTDDNANILCLDSEYEGDSPLEIAKVFLTTSFAGMDTRHGRRFGKVVAIENKN